jgi:1,4-dihydroxy-2-naphthoate octaprenyltransferase
MVSDNNKGLKTIPLLIGKSRTILFLTVLNIVSVIVLLYGIHVNFIPAYGISLSVFFIYTEYYLLKGLISKQEGMLKYTYMMADAEFIFWPLVLIVSKFLFNR